MFSRDIIEIFVGQDPDQMVCHKWADQMIGLWNMHLGLGQMYRHDQRLHHEPPSAYMDKFKTERNICSNYIGVHGSYPEQMRTLWKNRGSLMEYLENKDNKTLDDHISICNYPSILDWRTWKDSPE